MFVVPRIMKSITINVGGREIEVALKSDDGQIGACPVFETREDAEKYADGAGIMEIRYPEEK